MNTATYPLDEFLAAPRRPSGPRPALPVIALSVESQRSGVDYCLARLDRLKMGEQQIVRGFDEALRSGGVLSECRQRVLISIAASLLQ